MARGYFQTNDNEDKKLYCEWYTEADYETGEKIGRAHV